MELVTALTWVLLKESASKGNTFGGFPKALGLPDVSLLNKLVVMVCNAEKCWAGCRTELWGFLLLLRPSVLLVAVLSHAMCRAALMGIRTHTWGKEEGKHDDYTGSPGAFFLPH